MKLTADNVHQVFQACLFRDEEETSSARIVPGIMTNFGFHPGRLEEHKGNIADMLNDLPTEFHESTGGGWSFLQACVTKDGIHWGEHPTMEILLVLGLATEQAKYLFPRHMWKALPGGMPYFAVTTAQPLAAFT